MRQHLEIRLAQLAKEIAASKTPKIDAAANALFEQIAKSHAGKAPSDWNRKPVSLKDIEQGVFEDWLSRVCPPGDVESVHAKWLESSDYADFCDENLINGAAQDSRKAAEVGTSRPSPEAAPPSAQKFKVGDRVRWLVETDVWNSCVVTGLTNYEDSPAVYVTAACGRTGLLKADEVELITAPEPAATPVALGVGWTNHEGKEAPILPLDTRVLIRWSDGHETGPYFLSSVFGFNTGSISAYKVVIA